MSVIRAHDHQNDLLWGSINVGSCSGTSIIVDPDRTIPWPVPVYAKVLAGTYLSNDLTETIKTFRQVLTGHEMQFTYFRFPVDGKVVANYQIVSEAASAVESYTLDALTLDLTRGYGEQITAGSARFRLGNSTYVHQAGAVYRDPSSATGAGTYAGTLDPSTGTVRLTAWTGGGANAVTLEALVTEVGGQPVDACTFRTPVAPIKSGSFQVRWSDCAGTPFTKTIDGTGLLEDGDCSISLDHARGVVRMQFGRWRLVSTLTPEDLASTWYSATAIVSVGGIDKIWQSHPALAETIIYNAVAQTYLPPDSALLGLDAAKLPPDGRALIYRRGMLVIVHHTASLAVETLSPTQVIDCGRERLYRAVILDVTGKELPADAATLDRVAGLLIMSPTLDLTGFSGPYEVRHTIADLRRVRDTDINGVLTLTSPVTHTYPVTTSQVSGLLFAGTLQARVSTLFAQSAWTGVWSDTLIGAEPLCQYNDAQYPIVIANAGAYPDRILVRFTTATAYQVIGENLGVIAIGSTTVDCAPTNPLTDAEYFRIPYQGWGTGWAAGNCLRFNLHGACYPVACVRAVQPSEAVAYTDQVQLLLVGNVDNPS
jgi:hypothetical protein